jgi:sugar phosphate isomerase/epimerase
MSITDCMIYSRRDFGFLLLAGLPLSIAAAKAAGSRINGVQIGAITYSYRSIPNAEAILKTMADEGFSEVELMSNHAEALAGSPPEERHGESDRGPSDELRAWRKTVSMDRFKNVRKRFNAAGIDLHLLTYNMNVMTTTDEEIEYGFQMAKALGVKAITTSTQVSMAKRVAPLAEKHRMIVGFHGHDHVDRPDEVSTEATFQAVMAASRYIHCNLDIGHYTAANGDAVAFIRKYHDRITNLHVKDRKKNHGPNMPFGEGDTPIREVLQLMKRNRYKFPANIEFEYEGDPLVEVPKCLDYCRKALA